MKLSLVWSCLGMATVAMVTQAWGILSSMQSQGLMQQGAPTSQTAERKNVDDKREALRNATVAVKDLREKYKETFNDLRSKRKEIQKTIKQTNEDFKASIMLARQQVKKAKDEAINAVRKFRDAAKTINEVNEANILDSNIQTDTREAERAIDNVTTLEVPKTIPE